MDTRTHPSSCAPSEAVEALNTLKPADITVVKSMKNPPPVIKLVMAAVCVMLEIKPEKGKSSTGKVVSRLESR